MVLSCRGCQNGAFMGFREAHCKFCLDFAAWAWRKSWAIAAGLTQIRRRRLGRQQRHGIGKLQRFLIPPRQAAQHNGAFLSLSAANHGQNRDALVDMVDDLAVDFLIS